MRRLLWLLPTLFGVAVCVFVLMRVVPGDPVALMAGPGASVEDIERIRAQHGLDRPLAVQFAHWLTGIARGDWGDSLSLGRPVLSLIGAHLPATLELVLVALLPACGGALCVALLLTHIRGAAVRAPAQLALNIAQGVPDFLWALLLMLALGVWLPLLPVSGRSDPALASDFETSFHLLEALWRLDLHATTDLLRHLLLPATSLALPFGALLARVLTVKLREAMAQQYVLSARALGLSRMTVMRRVALRNAWVPALAFGGTQLVFLLGGTVLIEQVYGFPGVGRLAMEAVARRDLPLVQGLVLTFSLLFLLVRWAVDLLLLWVDPRMRITA